MLIRYPQASPNVAQTTIYYVQTITALMTSTATQTSTTTFCPSVFSSYLQVSSAAPSPGVSGGTSVSSASSGPSGTGTVGSQTGPCPGQGYTCSECLNGWFCPPSQTPAAQVPCGLGWPCYHCQSGYFCVPASHTVFPALDAHAYSTPSTQALISTDLPTADTYQYVGCYQDNSDRSLRDAQLLSVAGGMTTEQCVDFCQTQNFPIAGTEYSTQCFCGNLLLDSVNLDEGQCNMTCSGDNSNLSMCGGSWALSIWTIDGNLQQSQSQSLGEVPTALNTPGLQDTLADESALDAATTVYTTLPPGLALITETASLVTLNASNVGSAFPTSVAVEVDELPPVRPAIISDRLDSESMTPTMDTSSIASESSGVIDSGITEIIAGSTDIPLAPGPVIPSMMVSTSGQSSTSLAFTAAASQPATQLSGSNFTSDESAASPANDDTDNVKADAAKFGGSYIFPSSLEASRSVTALHQRADVIW